MSSFSQNPQTREVDPAETQRRLTARTALVVDVREPREWHEGRIEGARHIPLGSLREHAAELLAASEVIFVCHSGARSAAATDALTAAGHPNAYNMAGGMLEWSHQDLPVER